jgi:hypothetical protein
MHVLLITHFDPQALGGSPDRGRGIEAGLVANGHRVELLRLPVRKPPWAPRHLPWWYLRPSRRWEDRLRAAVDRSDLIVASYLPAAAATARALGRRRRFIYDAHNDELRLSEQFRPRRSNRHIGRLEERVMESAEAVWIAGAADHASMQRRFPGAVFHDLPNGAPDLPDMSEVAPRASSAYVYGSWGYEPNRDGLRKLSGAQTPIRGELHVFGHMEEALRRDVAARAARAQPNLAWKFSGFVDTLDSMVEAARGPGVLPVWMGAGTKLRAVQIAALGVPLITTSEGVAGLPEWFKRQTTVRDDPAELIEAALTPDPARWTESKRLRDAVGSELSWARLVADALAATHDRDQSRPAPA